MAQKAQMGWTKEELQGRIQSTAVMSDGKTRFSEELRRDVVEYSKRRIAEGETRNSIAVELGMNAWTKVRKIEAQNRWWAAAVKESWGQRAGRTRWWGVSFRAGENG